MTYKDDLIRIYALEIDTLRERIKKLEKQLERREKDQKQLIKKQELKRQQV